MSQSQLQTKIKELENWLLANATHPDYQTVLKDKINLQKQVVNAQ